MTTIKNLITTMSVLFLMSACTSKKEYYLVKFTTENRDNTREISGYKNSKGDLIIPAGKYDYCFTDTIRSLGIVVEKETGKLLGIDRNANKLFEIFRYDNGPDYEKSGLFRILKNGKIGYANTDGNIVIAPQFECAYPFDGAFAKVSNTCETIVDGEYSSWSSEHWYLITKDGNRLEN